MLHSGSGMDWGGVWVWRLLTTSESSIVSILIPVNSSMIRLIVRIFGSLEASSVGIPFSACDLSVDMESSARARAARALSDMLTWSRTKLVAADGRVSGPIRTRTLSDTLSCRIRAYREDIDIVESLTNTMAHPLMRVKDIFIMLSACCAVILAL